MKTISKLASGLALAAISSTAFAAAPGIAITKHNLGAGNLTGGNYTNATTEICVFCHTPHNANQSENSVPLWNRSFSSAGYSKYSTLGTTSFDASEGAIGSVSLACLSCHDGTQAMDAMLNSPGAGSGGVGGATTTSSIAAGTLTGHGGWNETNVMSTFGSGINDNGNVGDMIYLGTDLRNDHPISMQYGGGGISTGTPTGATTDPDYAPATNTTGTPGGQASSGSGSVNSKVLASGATVFWVDTGTGGKQKSDFPLFTRGTEVYVECATCHDPHTNNELFLRLSTGNTNSGVCLTCHTK